MEIRDVVNALDESEGRFSLMELNAIIAALEVAADRWTDGDTKRYGYLTAEKVKRFARRED